MNSRARPRQTTPIRYPKANAAHSGGSGRTERLPVSLAADIHDELLVAEGLLDWLPIAMPIRTAHRDMGVKFVEYEQHGVQEYWVLDPETLAHRFYARRGEVLTEFAAGESVIRSTVVPGLRLRRAWLTPDQPPNV